MTIIACKDCNAQISQNAKACPQCGCPVDHGLSNVTVTLMTVVAAGLAFLMFGFYLSSRPGAAEARQAKDQYKVCVKLTAYDPAQKLTCDSTIDNFRANFRAKYGRNP